jgi:hypothetical protein
VAGILSFSPYAMLSFAFLLMVFETMFFNSVLAANQIITRVSTVGAFVFLLLMNLSPQQTGFYPFLLASPFVLMLIHALFLVYQTHNPELYLFNVGVLFALSTMCCFSTILLLLWGIMALFMMHKTSFRLQIIPFVGFFTSYFLLFSGYYIFGDLKALLQSYAAFFSSLSFSLDYFNLKNVIVLAFLMLSIMFPFFKKENYAFEKSIAVRLKISITMWLFFFALVFLFTNLSYGDKGLIYIVLSILISYELSYIKKSRLTDVVLIAFALFVLANHYVPLFI